MKDHDPVRFGARLDLYSTGQFPTKGDVDKLLVVFVHGFTANGAYFEDHAELVQNSGYLSSLFQYDSYVGIGRAAAILAENLGNCPDEVRKYGVALIGHSMGGLVIRTLLNYYHDLAASIRAIVLLGTPNDGTLKGKHTLRRLLDCGEYLSKKFSLSPYVRSAACLSAKELMGQDDDQFIERLNDTERGRPVRIPTLTISGGNPFIDLKSTCWNLFVNRSLNNIFRGEPNDGIVLERSANLGLVLGDDNRCVHYTSYLEYDTTNHTALALTQAVRIKIVDFLGSI